MSKLNGFLFEKKIVLFHLPHTDLLTARPAESIKHINTTCLTKFSVKGTNNKTLTFNNKRDTSIHGSSSLTKDSSHVCQKQLLGKCFVDWWDKRWWSLQCNRTRQHPWVLRSCWLSLTSPLARAPFCPALQSLRTLRSSSSIHLPESWQARSTHSSHYEVLWESRYWPTFRAAYQTSCSLPTGPTGPTLILGPTSIFAAHYSVSNLQNKGPTSGRSLLTIPQKHTHTQKLELNYAIILHTNCEAPYTGEVGRLVSWLNLFVKHI